MRTHLNLNQLKAFYFACKYGSITRAAAKLFVTQPAVSMQIKALERQHDLPLFARQNNRFDLTDEGKKLYELAERIFGLIDEAEDLLGKRLEFPTDVLKVGSTKTLLRYLLPQYIATFQEAFPRIHIQLNEGSSEEMVKSVLEHLNDLAIVGRVPYGDRLRVIPFIQDQLLLMTPPNHRLCEFSSVSLEDLRNETLILREKGSGTRRLTQSLLQDRGIFPRVVIEAGNVDFIKELVKSGKGITILASMGVQQDKGLGSFRVLPLREGPLILDVDIVMSHDLRPSPAARSFLDLLLETKRGPSQSKERSVKRQAVVQ